ncbi:PP0621 family protein [Thiomicrospira sp. WB1]|uniref:PP0621 family protein n=1 Tax=Thiomicrospira sp. WB1 TaxID=1685380 RepID=UPI00083807C4|nr:PP0621 family protein [Thiomicrospira sp. WB1]
MRALFYFFLILVVFFLVLFVYSRVRLFRQNMNAMLNEHDDASQAEQTQQAADRMVACEQCGLHLPESEAIMEKQNGQRRYFCSQTHRDQAKETP